MPKVKWSSADADQALTADDIDNAEADQAAYAGDLPPAGVYRFVLKRSQSKEFGSGNMGFNTRFVLDGSWKKEHSKYNGAPLWDRVVLTKSAAGFVKAWALALGVTSADVINNTVVDTDGYVTAIGKRKIDGQDLKLYINVKRDPNPDYSERLVKSGTGFVVLEADAEEEAAEEAPTSAPAGKKGKKGKEGKKGKASAADDEPPF